MKNKRDLLVYLEDIIESAEMIGDYLSGLSEGSFYNSSEKQDAVLRRIQIIGEAAKHMSAFLISDAFGYAQAPGMQEP